MTELLVERVRASLRDHANPDKAPEMQAYMKSAMPFLGVSAPDRRAALRPVFSEHPVSSSEEYESVIRALWDGAEFREERYAALDFAGRKKNLRFDTIERLPLWSALIVSGAWWDLVDAIAGPLFDPIFAQTPQPIERELARWATHSDLWLRRSAIIGQRKRKSETNVELLAQVIEANLADADFFIRKAIGWALRSYSYVDPAWVRSFVREHEDQLSGLSKREALKVIDEKKGR
jgi:3-methyladenine DNA glycosylase AlkD